MFIRSLANVFHKTRAATRFATTVRRRMSLTDEASAAGQVPGELMQDAYAQAIKEIPPTNRRSVSSAARSILELPSAPGMNHARPAG